MAFKRKPFLFPHYENYFQFQIIIVIFNKNSFIFSLSFKSEKSFFSFFFLSLKKYNALIEIH